MTATADRATVNPGTVVAVGVQRVLELARTWLAWDGTPRVAEDGARVYTPNKAIRRHADHLIDHLAEIEALLAGAPAGQRGRPRPVSAGDAPAAGDGAWTGAARCP